TSSDPDAPAPILCPSGCTDITTDANNCGSCSTPGNSTACPKGEICKDSQCTAGCVPPQTACSVGEANYCANLTDDVNNCGDCGIVCLAGQVCEIPTGQTTGACTCPPYTPDVGFD